MALVGGSHVCSTLSADCGITAFDNMIQRKFYFWLHLRVDDPRLQWACQIDRTRVHSLPALQCPISFLSFSGRSFHKNDGNYAIGSHCPVPAKVSIYFEHLYSWKLPKLPTWKQKGCPIRLLWRPIDQMIWVHSRASSTLKRVLLLFKRVLSSTIPRIQEARRWWLLPIKSGLLFK